MAAKIDGIVDSDHPSVVNGIRNMIQQGYRKETIQRIIGAPAELIESHQRQMQHQGLVAKPERSDSERREILERMKKMREKRKPKPTTLMEILKPENE